MSSLYDEYLKQVGASKINPKSASDIALENAKNSAYKNMQESQKYINQGIKMNGLANQGISETTKLGLNNQYNQSLNQAYSNYAVNKQNEMDKANQLVGNTISNLGTYQQALNYLNEQKGSLGDNYYNSYKNVIDNQFASDNATKDLELASTEDDYNNILKKYQGVLNSNDYQALQETVSQGRATIGNAIENNELLGVDMKKVSSNFGKFNDGKKQQTWVYSIINNGKWNNGDVVNFNYGKGTPSNYMYSNGRWIKTSKEAHFDSDNYYDKIAK